MPRFHYKAADSAGATSEGVMEAASQDAVLERLRSSERLPIRIDELTAESERLDNRLLRGLRAMLLQPIFERPPLSRRALAMVSREISTLLGAGLPLTRALSVAAKAASDRRTAQALMQLHARVQAGAALSSAMAGHPAIFDRFYVAMIRAGEARGDLSGVLESLYEEISRSEDARDAIRQALAYPIILLFVATLSVVILLVFVLPQFEVLFRESGADLPLATHAVIASAGFLRDFGWLVLAGAVLGWIVLRVALRDVAFRRRWHRGLLGTPVVGGLITTIELQRYNASLAMLLAGGVHLPEALATAHEGTGNLALKHALANAADQVRQGESLANALERQGRIPARGVELVRIGEEVGDLATMVARTAEIYQRQTQAATRRFVTYIEPALILVIGLIVAGLVFSVLSAIVGINALVI